MKNKIKKTKVIVNIMPVKEALLIEVRTINEKILKKIPEVLLKEDEYKKFFEEHIVVGYSPSTYEIIFQNPTTKELKKDRKSNVYLILLELYGEEKAKSTIAEITVNQLF